MARYLVTGGAGFIGSHLVEALVHAGQEVTVVDDLSTGKMANLIPFQRKIRMVDGNLCDRKVAEEGVRGAEVVFHEAALGSVPKSVEDPRSSHEANVTSSLELLIAAKDAGVKMFVNAASSSAYGDTEELPVRESMIPRPLSPYATTKLAQEHYSKAFSASYGLPTVSLRYFNVYGPRQDPESRYAAVIPNFFTAFLKNEPPTIYGDGEQTRDFTFVADVVAANLAAARHLSGRGEVFNIAGGKTISINELARKISLAAGSKIQPKHVEARVGDVRQSFADISLARKILGYSPAVHLDEGLRRTLEWFRA